MPYSFKIDKLSFYLISYLSPFTLVATRPLKEANYVDTKTTYTKTSAPWFSFNYR
ncbi:hypothetical protein TUM3792_44080 [Shewanella sp. MBTL60-007]|nr:hypothetical protein TUM3792_44080 [Shewanella sp. MBTL60-007]